MRAAAVASSGDVAATPGAPVAVAAGGAPGGSEAGAAAAAPAGKRGVHR